VIVALLVGLGQHTKHWHTPSVPAVRCHCYADNKNRLWLKPYNGNPMILTAVSEMKANFSVT